MVRVIREEDYGIDFYCHPKSPDGRYPETVTDLAGVQVKGGSEALSYGELNAKREWRKHHFEWLRSLAIPLYLATVPRDLRSCEVFSLAPFVSHSVNPFEVTFITRPPSNSHNWTLTPPHQEPGENGGDGVRWTVDLGLPILHLSVEDPVEDQEFRHVAAQIFLKWIAQDRSNLVLFQQSIPVFYAFSSWKTNSIDGMSPQIWQHWNTTPGANLEPLCQTVEPLLVSLGIQFKDSEQSRNLRSYLGSGMAREGSPLGWHRAGLLGQLTETHELGLAPGENPKPPPESGSYFSPSEGPGGIDGP
jgi:hypothetical protein